MKGKKSNLLMKLGVLTLVVSIVSCSMVSGAFAKYTTTVSGTDSARVAKFAFDLKDADGNNIMQDDGTMKVNLLDMTYEDAVMSLDDQGRKLIAPGTKGSFTVEVENQSEVAVTAAFRIDERQYNGDGDQISGKADPLLDADGNPLLDADGNPVVDLDANGKLKSNDKVLLPIVYSVDLGTAATPDVRYYSDLYIGASQPITVGGETISGDLKQMAQDMATASSAVLMWQDSGVAGAVTARTYTVNWQWAFEGSTDMPISPMALGATADPIELQSDMMDTMLGLNMAATDGYNTDLATSVEVTVNVVVSQVDELPPVTPPAP